MKLHYYSTFTLLSIFWLVGCSKEYEIDKQSQLQSRTMADHELDIDFMKNEFPCSTTCRKSLPRKTDSRIENDQIILVDLELILRKISLAKSLDETSIIYFSETEITNEMYSIYLDDVNLFRDDSNLEAVARTQSLSTGDILIQIKDTSSLWYRGEMPFNRNEHPVSLVSTEQAIAFCTWLNNRYQLHGTFRLPNEEEWLFAAYGNSRKFPWGDGERDWTSSHSGPVHQNPHLKTPDGLYGMWGNVSELVLSDSDGYGNTIVNRKSPVITKWLGTSHQYALSRGLPIQPRQQDWGFTHSSKSRSDKWGFRIVFVPKEAIWE